MRLGVGHLPTAEWPPETFPGYEAPVAVRGGPAGDLSAEPTIVIARFGLAPRWSRDAAHAASIAKGTYNARSETAFEKPSFRGPWRERQWALVPMENYFDPCWETGKAVRWRLAMANGGPFACAGLWERWHARLPGAENDASVTSFSLLTVNADDHPLCGRLHRPGDEKRMPVIIAESDFKAWLHATPETAKGFLRAAPAQWLIAEPAPQKPRKPKMPEEASLF